MNIGVQTEDIAVSCSTLTPTTSHSNPTTPGTSLPVPPASLQPPIFIANQPNGTIINNNNNNTIKMTLPNQPTTTTTPSSNPIIIPMNQKGCRLALQNGQLILINDNNNQQTQAVTQLPLQTQTSQPGITSTTGGLPLAIQPGLNITAGNPNTIPVIPGKPNNSLQSIQPCPSTLTIGGTTPSNGLNGTAGVVTGGPGAPGNGVLLKNNAITTPLYSEDASSTKSAQSIRISTPNGTLMMNTRRQQPNQMPAALVLPSGQIIPVVTRPGSLVTQSSAPRNSSAKTSVPPVAVSSTASLSSAKSLPNTISAMINNEGNIILTMPPGGKKVPISVASMSAIGTRHTTTTTTAASTKTKRTNNNNNNTSKDHLFTAKMTSDLLAQATESIFSASPPRSSGRSTPVTTTSISLSSPLTAPGVTEFPDATQTQDDEDHPLQIVVEPPSTCPTSEDNKSHMDTMENEDETDISDFSDLIRIPTGNTPHKAKRKLIIDDISESTPVSSPLSLSPPPQSSLPFTSFTSNSTISTTNNNNESTAPTYVKTKNHNTVTDPVTESSSFNTTTKQDELVLLNC